MKRYWLRGILLGVSVALLLAGGVALAQEEILIATDPTGCVECSRDPKNPNWLALYTSGWQGDETITCEICKDGLCLPTTCMQAEDGEFNDPEWTWWDCEPPTPPDPAGNSDAGAQVVLGPLGEWFYRFTGNSSGRSGSFTILVAEVCEEEFVPEPGSIMLLGSGLVGLAGYATMRWRTRE